MIEDATQSEINSYKDAIVATVNATQLHKQQVKAAQLWKSYSNSHQEELRQELKEEIRLKKLTVQCNSIELLTLEYAVLRTEDPFGDHVPRVTMCIEQLSQMRQNMDSLQIRNLVTLFYNLRGYLYLFLQKYNSALEDLTISINQNPSYVVALHNRGDCYRLLRQYNKAVVEFTKCIQLEPNYLPPYYGMSLIHTERQEEVSVIHYLSILNKNNYLSSVEIRRYIRKLDVIKVKSGLVYHKYNLI
jgi:tetratricopeptide (TPR) repeat protein